MSHDKFDERLQEELARLPRDIQPQRDLWPGIDLALEDEVQRTTASPRWIGVAASLAVMSLVTLLAVNRTGISPAPGSELQGLVNIVSQQHEQQKQLLLTSYEQQPALTDDWREQLREMEAAAAVIRQALEQDPGNARLIGLLQQVYQQQIKLIRSVHRPAWF